MPLDSHQEFLIDFKLYDVPELVGFEIPATAAAQMLGVSQADFDARVQVSAQSVRAAAAALAAEAEVATALRDWDLGSRATVMTVGDSITAYRQSYAELLSVLLAHARPDAPLEFLNVAESGHTTANALQETYTRYLAKQPGWVSVLYGANDATHIEGETGRTLVTLDEYASNLREIVRAFRAHTSAKMVLLTAPPVVEARSDAAYGALHLAYRNATLAGFAGAVRDGAKAEQVRCVDLFALFGVPADETLFGPDGLHPNLAGQGMIAREFLRHTS
jgi:lysophospholipase L1-like esterase